MLNEVLDLDSIFVSRALELHNINYISLQQLFSLVLVGYAQLLFLLRDVCHVGSFRVSECREATRFVGLRFRALGRQAIFGDSLHIQQFIMSQHDSTRLIFLEEGPVRLYICRLRTHISRVSVYNLD